MNTLQRTRVATAHHDTLRAGSRASSRGSKPRVMVLVDHALVAAGVHAALPASRWQVRILDRAALADAVTWAQRLEPACILIDSHLDGSTVPVLDLVAPLRATGAAVVILTAERRRSAHAEFLAAGAAGWISKSAELDHIESAVHDVVAGRPMLGRNERAALIELLRTERSSALRAQETFDRLTRREALVLCALADGYSADEIAARHFVALTTVRSQIRSVLHKLDVRSQLAAVSIADAHRHLLPSEGTIQRDRRRTFRQEQSVGAVRTAQSA